MEWKASSLIQNHFSLCLFHGCLLSWLYFVSLFLYIKRKKTVVTQFCEFVNSMWSHDQMCFSTSSIPFNPIQFNCAIPFSSILFDSILFYSLLFFSILLYWSLFCSIQFSRIVFKKTCLHVTSFDLQMIMTIQRICKLVDYIIKWLLIAQKKVQSQLS